MLAPPVWAPALRLLPHCRGAPTWRAASAAPVLPGALGDGFGEEVCLANALLLPTVDVTGAYVVAAKAECLVDLFQDCFADDVPLPTVAVTGAFEVCQGHRQASELVRICIYIHVYTFARPGIL